MNNSVITIAQQKGGAGKTTIAANLAVAFHLMGRKVALIDVDPQQTLSKWYEIRQNALPKEEGFLHKTVTGWRIYSEIERLSDQADVIIIDSPPNIESEVKTVIRAADLVLVPSQPSPADFWSTENTLRLISGERVPYRVLLNRVVAGTKILEDLRPKFPSLLKSSVGNRTLFANALAQGKSVIELAPSTTAAIEIVNLATEVGAMLFAPQKPASKDQRVPLRLVS